MGNSASKKSAAVASMEKPTCQTLPPAYDNEAYLNQTIQLYAQYGSKWCLGVGLPDKWIDEFNVLVYTKTKQSIKQEALVLLAHNYANQIAATGSIHTFEAPSFFCRTFKCKNK